MEIQFKDKTVKVSSLNMECTFQGHIEGSYESVSKHILADEYEKAKRQRQGYYLIEPCLVENHGYKHCLPEFRYEIHFDCLDIENDNMSILTLVFFAEEPADNVSLKEFISAYTKDLLFFELADSFMIFDDLL